MTCGKLLIVNADDFGFTRDVNEGILKSHLEGIVTATTLMANGAAFEHAVEMARRHPSLDVGCHLVLVGGNSVLPPYSPLPASLVELVRAASLRRIDVLAELRAQVRRIVDSGLAPTHLDTHKHTQLLPQVAAAVGRVSQEFGVRWVRRPLSFPVARAWLTLRLQRNGCRMTDRFEGFRLTGRLDAAALAELAARLQPGLTELMCHPGRLGEELLGARTRLKKSRELELEALVSPTVKAALREAGVELVNYRSLP